MKSLSIRQGYIFKSYFKNFIKKHGLCLLILLTLCVLSVLTACFSVSKYNGGISEKDFFDKVLFFLSDGELSFWQVFFNRFFYVLLLIIILLLTAQNKFLFILNALTLIVSCYLIGIDIGIIFGISSLRGILFCCCVYIPFMLFLLIGIVLLDCVFIKKVQEYSKYGAVCYSKDNYAILFILLFVIILLQSFIFPIFNNIFIIIT